MANDVNNGDILYMKIKQEIIHLNLKPGEQLRERELAEKYNVSRTPIRQALQKLSVEGLVEFIPYKGAFIKELTIEEFKDITQLRMLLEKFAIEKCCESTDENVIKGLQNIIKKQKEAMINNDVKEYSLLDQEFHYSIIKVSNNKELEKVYELLNQRSYLSRVRSLLVPGQMERSIVGHQNMVDYIIKKDKEKAGKTASSHVEDALQMYIQVHDIMMSF